MDIGNNTRAPNGDYKIGPIEWGPREYQAGLRGVTQCADEDAELWSVYLREEHFAEWCADFHTRADCELFVGALAIRDNARGE